MSTSYLIFSTLSIVFIAVVILLIWKDSRDDFKDDNDKVMW